MKNKEKLEEAKRLYESANADQKYVLESLFPELKESEDERIRKAIIELVKQSSEILGLQNQSNMLAWLDKQGTSYTKTDVDNAYVEGIACAKNELEKQGKQNIADKIKPKFHEGDWIVQGCNILKIRCVGNEYYCFETVGGYVDDMLVSEIDSLYHLWTIQDAKDGDVLVNGSNIFIFHFINGTRLMGYCHINTDDGRFYDDLGKNECFCLIDAIVTPATKEQRDLLFQKMHEAGYTFDFEKKELKKIEDEEYNGEDYGIDGLWHAQRILEKTLGIVDGYQTDDGILSHKCAITAVKKLYESKPSWSVEDTFKVQRICEYLNEAKKYYADITEVRECIEWLKSLKDRVQPKQEWNKGDMDMLNAAISFVKHSSFTTIGKGKNNTVAWLKSLKDRYTWKPSKGQLECLGYAIDKAEKDYSPLANNRIYLTLKALKEELEKLKG